MGRGSGSNLSQTQSHPLSESGCFLSNRSQNRLNIARTLNKDQKKNIHKLLYSTLGSSARVIAKVIIARINNKNIFTFIALVSCSSIFRLNTFVIAEVQFPFLPSLYTYWLIQPVTCNLEPKENEREKDYPRECVRLKSPIFVSGCITKLGTFKETHFIDWKRTTS